MDEQDGNVIECAISKANAGNKEEARRLLANVLKHNASNARAWYLLSQIVDRREESIYCLQEVLRIAPGNRQAKSRLEELEGPSQNLIDKILLNSSNEEPPEVLETQQKITQTQVIDKRHKGGRPRNRSNKRLILICLSVIGIMGIFIAGFLFLFLMFGQKKGNETINPSETIASNPISYGFIDSLKDFENSTFCKTYRCILAGKLGQTNSATNYAYQITNYGDYNDVLIEMTVINGEITEYAISLDPLIKNTSFDFQLAYSFLSSIYLGSELSSQITDFVFENSNNHVSQICLSKSIEFHSKKLWVGMVGLTPTILVADLCAYSASNPTTETEITHASISVNTDTPGPIETSTPTPLPASSPFETKGEFGDWQISIDRVLVAELIKDPTSHKIEKAKGRFVILFLTITNKGYSPDTFLAGANFRIRDAEGNIFEEALMPTLYTGFQYNMEINGVELNPDESRQVVTVFDISKESAYYVIISSILSELHPNVYFQAP